jgi:hypothetical protein
MLTMKEMARRIGVKDLRIIEWRREGRVTGQRSNYRTEYLYVEPTPEQIATLKRTRP